MSADNNALFAGLEATPRDTPDVNPVREREPGSTEAARAHSQSSASREPDFAPRAEFRLRSPGAIARYR